MNNIEDEEYVPLVTAPEPRIKTELRNGLVPRNQVGLRKRKGNYKKKEGEHTWKPTGKVTDKVDEVNMVNGRGYVVKPMKLTEEDKDEFLDKKIVLSNDRQELYCKLRAEGQTKSGAYRMAYPESSSPAQSAQTLERREDIQIRIRQLMEERAVMSKLVDPQESLARWNTIYLEAHEKGDIKTMIKAQENIDIINGSKEVSSIMKNQLQTKGLFRGDDDSEWKKMAERLANILITSK